MEYSDHYTNLLTKRLIFFMYRIRMYIQELYDI